MATSNREADEEQLCDKNLLLGICPEPVCLISTNENGTFSINEGILDIIQNVFEMLHVICIAGLYRTGKSYLMNRLACVKKGFPLGNTIQSKTKGIWVWLIRHPTIEDHRVLLMDTEGLGDVKKGDPDHDNQLMTLATLLSSTLIYNVKGAFDQDTLDKMTFVTEMSKRIKMMSSQSESADGDFDTFCPTLIITIRDFSLDLIKDGIPISEAEYLDDCLTVPKEKGADNRFKHPRFCIRKYFKYKYLVTLESPGSKATLKKLESLSDQDLNPSFLEDAQRFLELVYKHSKPICLQLRIPLSGPGFADLVIAYVESINYGNVPCIESATARVITNANNRAVAEGIRTYKEGMHLPYADSQALTKAHDLYFEEANKVFMKIAMVEINSSFIIKFNEQLTVEYSQIDKEDNQASTDKCKSMLKNLFQSINKKAENGNYSKPGGYKDITADVEQKTKEYNEIQGLGRQKQRTYQSFVNERRLQEQIILAADNTLTKNEQELITERKAKEKILHEKEEADTRLKNEKEAAEEKQKYYEVQEKELLKKYAEDEEIERFNYEQLMAKRIEEEGRILKEGHLKEMEQLKKEQSKTKQELASNSRKATCVSVIRTVSSVVSATTSVVQACEIS